MGRLSTDTTPPVTFYADRPLEELQWLAERLTEALQDGLEIEPRPATCSDPYSARFASWMAARPCMRRSWPKTSPNQSSPIAMTTTSRRRCSSAENGSW
jgi:hypothetical protein